MTLENYTEVITLEIFFLKEMDIAFYKLKNVVLLVFILYGNMNCGEFKSDNLSDAVVQNLDEIIKYMMDCRKIPGMNIAIVHNNETILTKGYGYSNLEKKIPVTNKTLFSVASLTKAFTTTLLGQILQDKGYTWHTPVRNVLGDEFYFNDTLRTNETTLGDLASHSLGIPSHNYVRLAILERKELMQRLRFMKPTKQFRGSWSYNNLMYGLLSHVTEILGDKDWEDLITDHIFKPNDMKSSNFMHKVDLNKSNIATSYIEDENDQILKEISNKLHSIWGILGGTGSIISNADDMAMWLHFQLNEGVSMSGKQIMNSKIVRDTQIPVNLIPQSKSDALYKQPKIPATYEHGKYGYGWRIGYYKGYKMILHTGSSWGFGALLTLMPDFNIGIYTSINGGDNGYHGRRLLHMYIVDILSNNESWINKSVMCNFPKHAMRFEKPPSLRLHLESFTSNDDDIIDDAIFSFNKIISNTEFEMDKYVGRYGNYGYGNVTVTIVKEDLFLLYGEIGIWKLRKVNDFMFSGKAQGLIWALDMDHILFGHDEFLGTISYVQIPIEKSDPQTFYRDRKFENAPPPPNPNIGSPCTNNNINISFNYILVIVCIIIAILMSLI